MAVTSVAIGARPFKIGSTDQVSQEFSGDTFTISNGTDGGVISLEGKKTGSTSQVILTTDPDGGDFGKCSIASAIEIFRESGFRVVASSGTGGNMAVRGAALGGRVILEATNGAGDIIQMLTVWPNILTVEMPAIQLETVLITSSLTGYDTTGISILEVDATAGNIVINTLAGGVIGKFLAIQRVDKTANTVTITNDFDGSVNSIRCRGDANKTLIGYAGTRFLYVRNRWYENSHT